MSLLPVVNPRIKDFEDLDKGFYVTKLYSIIDNLFQLFEYRSFWGTL